MPSIKNFDPLQNCNWTNYQKQLDSHEKSSESLKMTVKPLDTVRVRFEQQPKLDENEKMEVWVKSVLSKDLSPMDPNVLSACCCTSCCCSASC